MVQSARLARNSTSKLEEVNQISKAVCALIGDLENNVGHATIVVSHKCREHSGLVYKIKLFARNKVKSVNIARGVGNYKLGPTVIDIYYGFKKISLSVLNILTERMKVC